MSLSANIQAVPLSTLTFDWKRWPETALFVDRLIAKALESNAFAARLAERMLDETSTRFADWVDHLVISARPGLARQLAGLGYQRQTRTYATNVPVFAHEGGMFPRLAIVPQAGTEVVEVAIKVESIADFSAAHDLGMTARGYPLGAYRVGRSEANPTSFAVIERRGYLGFDPFSGEMARIGRMSPHAARNALAAREIWQTRRRQFEDDSLGFDVAEAALDRVIDLSGGNRSRLPSRF